jgi:CspA family cold shock protein
MDRSIGTVKWFSPEKGFGFITREDGTDIFVHHTSLNGRGFRTLDQGEKVEFEVVEEPKGLKAYNVVRTDAPAEGPGEGMRAGIGAVGGYGNGYGSGAGFGSRGGGWNRAPAADDFRAARGGGWNRADREPRRPVPDNRGPWGDRLRTSFRRDD